MSSLLDSRRLSRLASPDLPHAHCGAGSPADGSGSEQLSSPAATLQERSGAISGGARDRRNNGLPKPAYVGPRLVEGRMCLCGAWRRANRAALLLLDPSRRRQSRCGVTERRAAVLCATFGSFVCRDDNGASRADPAGDPASPRPRPVIAATPRSEGPGHAANPRTVPANPGRPRPACHAGGRGFESRRSR